MSDLTKICSKCRREKSIVSFNIETARKDGHKSICKECLSTKSLARKEADKEKNNLLEGGLKKCTICKEVKNISDFHKQNGNSSGYRTTCKSCRCKKSKEKQKIESEDSCLLEHGFRRCKECFNIKEINNFSKKEGTRGGLSYKCKDCCREIVKESSLKYRRSERVLEYQNSPKAIAARKKYRETHRAEAAEYRLLMKREKREYEKKLRKENINFKVARNLRCRVYLALKNTNSPKYFKHDESIGCTPEFLRQYLESKFLEGMSWGNYDKFGWHIDHILPCASFDLDDPAQQIKCFHYTNLQPMWAVDNWAKNKKIPA